MKKGTLKWYAIKPAPRKFGIFDTFSNEAGRNAHLTGEIAKALTVRANELFAVPPQIEKAEVLASTLEGMSAVPSHLENKEKTMTIKEKEMNTSGFFLCKWL
jgi:hypothetical protein